MNLLIRSVQLPDEIAVYNGLMGASVPAALFLYLKR